MDYSMENFLGVNANMNNLSYDDKFKQMESKDGE